jgi:small-conductance mechanosensitive channel
MLDPGRSLALIETWLSAHWWEILLALALGAAIVVPLLWLRGAGARIAARRIGWPATIGQTLAKTQSWFMLILAAKLVDGFAKAPAGLAQSINILFVIAFALQAALWARELILAAIAARVGNRPGEAGTLGSAMGLIRALVSFTLFAIAAVLILDNLGVNVTGIVAGLGIGGIAIGLAAQGIFSDLFAALAIIFDRPFKLGDTIRFGDATGTVEESKQCACAL